MMKKKIFFASRPTHGVYRAINLGCKKHAEKLTKSNFELKFFKKKIPSIGFFIFFFKNIINFNFINKKKYLNLTYRKCEIGRHATAMTYRDINTYHSIFHKLFNLIRYFFWSGMYVDHAYFIADDIDAAYIDHCGYLNGLYFRVFALKKKIIYTNNHPRGLFFIDFSKIKNKRLNANENAIRLFKVKKKYNLANSQKKILYFIKNPKLIPWMSTTKYKNISIPKSKIQNYDYVVYCHSFLDGNLWFGNDGFSNLRDWLEYTLEELKKNNEKVIIKAHPNFYNKVVGEYAVRDKKIFDEIKNKYQNKNFLFINESIPNSELMKRLSKKTILISHHGTSLLEGSVCGFKTICSMSTIWSPNFNISNQWFNPKDYSKVLKKKWKELRFTNIKDLNIVLYQLTKNKYAFCGNFHFHKIICRHFKINNFQYHSKYLIDLMNKTPQDSINKLASKLSSNVEKIYL
ncbi:hypothetical protein N8824_01560 [Candidatus Pelagibacter sp.]|nr:hypothetical protein [Candidatus Pelagibacter sp.]